MIIDNSRAMIASAAVGLMVMFTSPAAAFETIIGTWVGTIEQPGSGSYPGAMIMLSPREGTSAYSSFNCGGILTGKGSGGVYKFRETITYGHASQQENGCIDGNIEMVVRGDTLRWTWAGSYEGEKISATSVLRRVIER